MNYLRIYNNLINRAKVRTPPHTYTELHHIIPRSHAGTDDPTNLVRLTLKEHRLAHILLAMCGHSEQWYSVEAMLQDRLNKNRPHRFRHKDLKVTTFIRRKISKKHAYDRRQRGKAMLARLQSPVKEQKDQ